MKNQKFGKLVFATSSLMASQYSQFPCEFDNDKMFLFLKDFLNNLYTQRGA